MPIRNDSKGNFWTDSFKSKIAYDSWYSRNNKIFSHRRFQEEKLEQGLSPDGVGTIPGWCRVCGKQSRFVYERQKTDHGSVNWRESQICIGTPSKFLARIFGRTFRGCGLNSRQRLSVDFLTEKIGALATASIYITEQISLTAAAVRSRCKSLVSSEYLGADIQSGYVNSKGIRHEDLTQLSFSDGIFDAVISLDVLEHVADYRRAFKEIHRVLKPRAPLIASIPFDLGSDRHLVRVLVRDDGSIEHLLPPEYHGDPLNPDIGALCYRYYGWEILDELRASGFATASLYIGWSADYGYVGPEYPLVVATA